LRRSASKNEVTDGLPTSISLTLCAKKFCSQLPFSNQIDEPAFAGVVQSGQVIVVVSPVVAEPYFGIGAKGTVQASDPAGFAVFGCVYFKMTIFELALPFFIDFVVSTNRIKGCSGGEPFVFASVS
jgi:hypothetical protein